MVVPVARVKVARGTEALGKTLKIQGWIRSMRRQKSLAFLEVNDGSCQGNLQVVLDTNNSLFLSEVSALPAGTCVEIEGEMKRSEGSAQATEMSAVALNVIGRCDDPHYPMQKKRHNLETLREWPHLRARSNTIGAVLRTRSAAFSAVHDFYQGEGFCLVNTPIITSSDCEGAGETFRIAQGKEFFGNEAYLTVSGQLQAEAFAMALSRVYTFGPTFRAENSQTTRHLAEFWMIEPEIAFANMDVLMDNAEALVRSVHASVSRRCSEEMDFFDKMHGYVSCLEKAQVRGFARISYDDAVQRLQASGMAFEKPVVHGGDLASEHERWLAEVYAGGAPIFVHHYPANLKPFYVKSDEAFDLLVPGIGELIGGSMREEDHDVLRAKMERANMSIPLYQWYLDLRKFGGAPHGGYGVGFERLIRLLTGMENIRDTIPVPRAPHVCPL